jgi:hypothetical protein
MPKPRTLYRGYELEGDQRGRIWRITVRPIRPELPILGTHSVLRPTWPEAVAEAQARIDHLLAA